MSLEKTITTRATSGTIKNDFRTGYRVQISWNVNSQNVANNTSNVTVKAQLVSTSSGYYISSSATKNGSLTINGTTYSFTFGASLSGSQTKTVFTKTVDVPHNSDGSKTLSMSTTLGINVTLSGNYWGNVTASGSGVLNAIPRTSSMSLSASSVAVGSAITVNISRASSAFTHKVYYSFGNKSATISTNATTSASYTIPTDHATVIPNLTSGTATISVDTYNGSTYIGSTSKTFTVTVPTSIKPSLSSVTATLVESGASSSFGYVKGKSKVKLTINGATGSQGSTITSYNISGDGFSSSASSFTTVLLNTSGSITFTAYVTDSRGRRSDSKTVTINVNDYEPPKLLYPTVIRCNSSGGADNEGTYIKASFEYSNSAIVNGKVTNKVEFKATSSSTWTNAGSVTTERGLVFGSNGISTTSSYEVRITLSDTISTVTQIFTIPTSFVTMDFKKGGRGIAIGKASETDNLFDVGIDTTVRGQINANAFNFNGFKNWDSGNFNDTGGGASIVNDNGNYKALMILGNRSDGGNRKVLIYDDATVHGSLNVNGTTTTNAITCRGFIQLPSNGDSWLSGATNGNIRGSQQSSGSYHPIISQTTSSGHKVSLGGLGDDFGFHVYDKNRTENGVDKYWRISLGGKDIYTNMRFTVNDDWLYTTGNTGWYNSTYGGGWYMKDSSWVRSYNDKNIYTANTLRCGTTETRYIKGTQGGGNGNLDLLVYDGYSIYISPSASSGVSLYINRNWSGSSGSEPSFYNNKGNGWGYIGNSGQAFYRVYGSGGSVSDRTKKYEITKADIETQYENIKDLNIYNYRTISTLTTTVEQLAEDYFKNNFLDTEGKYITNSVVIDEKEYIELDENLSQEEIKELRIKEIIEKNPNFGECKREDLSLGCMVDEMPLETTFYDNEGGDGKSVDMYSYTTMIVGATKHLINKVENLEKENDIKDRKIEELESRLEKMEELLNGIINKG